MTVFLHDDHTGSLTQDPIGYYFSDNGESQSYTVSFRTAKGLIQFLESINIKVDTGYSNIDCQDWMED